MTSPDNKWDRRAVAEEPFRLFFPMALLAGVIGVLLWPLHLLEVTADFPGSAHARLMAFGFFGGFMFGFLGTALPRMLSVPPFRFVEVLFFLGLHMAMVLSLAVGKETLGDGCLGILLLTFCVALGLRLRQRKDVPPPGFILVPLAFACALAGLGLTWLEPEDHGASFWMALQPLIFYQGFVLLPILGVGPFFLPRILGLPNRHDFDESITPPPGWKKKAVQAGLVGLGIVGSFVLESAGFPGFGNGLRCLICGGWMIQEVPIHRAGKSSNVLAFGVRVAMGLFVLGFLTAVFFPAYRVAMLHLVLMGGFGILTLTVATRVVYGHAGLLEALEGRNRWFKVVVWLILIGMATRMSGDFWPGIMKSHYIYGAILWILGLAIWSGYVLPKVRRVEPD